MWLSSFLDGFDRALLATPADGEVPADVARLVRQPGFKVYRNTVIKGCIDALQVNFPSVVRLVGDEWFRAAAREYLTTQLPREPSLAMFGDTFPAFLAGFEPARAVPYLAAVAAVDRCWSEAHAAADAPLLDAGTVAALDAELSSLRFVPHPAARWRWDAEWPAWTLWSLQRDDPEASLVLEWNAEGVLVTRPFGAVLVARLARGGVAFLDACAAGQDAGRAVRAAFAADPDIDLANLMRQLLLAGALTSLQRADFTETT